MVSVWLKARMSWNIISVRAAQLCQMEVGLFTDKRAFENIKGLSSLGIINELLTY